MRIAKSLPTIFLLLTVSSSLCAQKSTPVMEYASVLTGIRVRHATGALEFENSNHALAAVFLPSGTAVEGIVTKKGSKAPLVRQTFAVSGSVGAFRRLAIRGNHHQFKFTQPGDYVLTYRANGRDITRVPFSIEFVSNNDEFNPKVFAYLNGPQRHWAYLYGPLPDAASDQPEFRMWARKKSFVVGRDADKYDVEVRLNGDVVAITNTGFISTQEGRELKFPLRHPDSKGGGALKISELTRTDGTYHVVVTKNGNLYSVWPFTVNGGKFKLHPRQASNYSPRTDYIVPRVSGITDVAPGTAVFMERLSDDAAEAIYSGQAASVAGPTEADRKRWEWLPRSIDPRRPFKFTVSGVETRTDTGFSVGEDVVVFGNGIPNGVKYLKAGDTKAREIPAGETYSAKVFCVCGSKIVLVKKNQVFVFDTASSTLTEIPKSDVFLYDVRPSLMRCHGYLVATVNKATAVTDKTIIKVVDVSGTTPKVIPIKNANYVDSDVTSVGVNAKEGLVVVASRSKKLITAAKVAPLANQHAFDLTDYRGVASFDISVEYEDVTYVDEDWKVRVLDLSEGIPKAITQQSIARSGNGLWVRKGRRVVVTPEEKTGSRYRVALTDSDDAPQQVPGTGTPIEGTSAALGMGGSVAIAIDKSVFLAGTAGDSIGTGERLQLLGSNGRWTPIMGADGKPVWGSEVVTSMGFMAMKVRNDSGKTVIGYATYGERIALPSEGAVVVSDSPKQSNAAPYEPLKLDQDSTHFTHDEAQHEILKGFLEVNQDALNALEGVFGKDGARTKMVEMAVNGLKAGNHEHLIDEFKRQSPLVPESEKPKAAPQTGQSVNVDPKAVAAALNGEWYNLRFTASGQDLPDNARESLKMIFANGSYVMTMGPNVETGTYEFDSATYPFALQIHIGSGKNKGQSRHGAFKMLEENRMMFVMATDGTSRPNKFVSTADNQNILAVYRKTK